MEWTLKFYWLRPVNLASEDQSKLCFVLTQQTQNNFLRLVIIIFLWILVFWIKNREAILNILESKLMSVMRF